VTGLVAWIFAAMVVWCPPSPVNVAQLGTYVRVAVAIARASDGVDDASLLASIGSFESQYHPKARGKLGELGVWQLMPPAPADIDAQAVEALRRWKRQGGCGYTGEAANPKSTCPLARHREDRAKQWVSTHPFEKEESSR
jgi:hypothetical protein